MSTMRSQPPARPRGAARWPLAALCLMLAAASPPLAAQAPSAAPPARGAPGRGPGVEDIVNARQEAAVRAVGP